MKNMVLGFACALLAFTSGASYATAPIRTPDEAVALVKKGVAFLKSHGRDVALAEFNKPDGQFVDRDLYIFVIDRDGTTLANGVNQKLVGKNVLRLMDANGKYFIRALMAVGDSKGRGWIEYKWSNHLTQAMELKQTYVEKVGRLYIASGIYK